MQSLQLAAPLGPCVEIRDTKASLQLCTHSRNFARLGHCYRNDAPPNVHVDTEVTSLCVEVQGIVVAVENCCKPQLLIEHRIVTMMVVVEVSLRRFVVVRFLVEDRIGAQLQMSGQVGEQANEVLT